MQELDENPGRAESVCAPPSDCLASPRRHEEWQRGLNREQGSERLATKGGLLCTLPAASVGLEGTAEKPSPLHPGHDLLLHVVTGEAAHAVSLGARLPAFAFFSAAICGVWDS